MCSSIPAEFKAALLDQIIDQGVNSLEGWLKHNDISYSYFRIALREMEREELVTLAFAPTNNARGFRPLQKIQIVA